MGNAGSVPESPHFSLERVVEGVYAAIASQTGAALSNSALVDLGDRTVVFDTFLTPQAAGDLFRASRKLFGDRPMIVVNSHRHQDHVRGNQQFPGAPILATRLTREPLEKLRHRSFVDQRPDYEKELEEAKTLPLPPAEVAFWMGSARNVLETLAEVRIIPPNWTFETEVDLHGPNRTARVMTFGGGHTPSDAFLFLPHERLAVMGDLLTVRTHPSMGDGNVSEWRRILAQVAGLGIDRAIPGHGPVGTKDDFATLDRHFEDMSQLARKIAARGRGGENAAKTAQVPPEYETWGLRRLFAENLQFLIGQNSTFVPAG